MTSVQVVERHSPPNYPQQDDQTEILPTLLILNTEQHTKKTTCAECEIIYVLKKL